MPTIGLIADLHRVEKHAGDVERMLDRVMGSLEATDHVVVMGDLIGKGHTGTYEEDADRDRAQLERVVARIERFDVPATYLLGNHEVTALGPDEVADVFDQDPYGRFDIAGMDAVVLDSSAHFIKGSPGAVTPEQLDFLHDVLPDLDDALLFVHHPVHYHNVEDNPWWDVYPERAFCGNKKEINHVLGKHGGIRAAFNAHLHEHDHTRYRGLDHVTVEPFSRKTPGDGPTGAHAVVDVGDEIAVEMRTPEETVAEYTF